MKSLWTTLRYTFSRLRWQAVGWGLGLAIYGVLMVSMYETMAVKQDTLQGLLANYPAEFLAFFGGDPNSPLTPAGFLNMYAFSMFPLIVGIYAVMVGSGLIVSDEEHGRLDLIIAHPVGRPPFFWGRTLGVLVATLSIMLLAWLGFSLALGSSSMGFTWGEMAIPFLSLFVQTLVYMTFALVLSLLLPSRSLAAMVSGAFLVASYLISSLAFMNVRLEIVSKVLPYHYYQVVLSMKELNLVWLFGLLGISLLMTLLAYLRFTRRDIRLSGEGSWLRS